jgi:exodeoxyribonuclease V alpha subunit
VEDAGSMTGETYEQWVAGIDIDAGRPKGRLRPGANALRFVEVVVNGPKTWSLAAALHPEVSSALDAAQDRAAAEIVGWVAQHATTRVGPRGRQVQVPVERIEAAVIRHYTSRAGDPHRHLHLQLNSRVWAAGWWRGIHSGGLRDSIEAINGIGHAAVATDPRFRSVLAAHGLTLEPETSEIRELAPYVGAFSARTGQIRRHVDRYEAAWRSEHPGEEPGTPAAGGVGPAGVGGGPPGQGPPHRRPRAPPGQLHPRRHQPVACSGPPGKAHARARAYTSAPALVRVTASSRAPLRQAR